MTTPLREQLEAHQAVLLVKIATAAQAADTRSILRLNDELRLTASLIDRMVDIGVEARAILDQTSPLIVATATPAERRVVLPKVAGRGHGVEIRAAFLDRAARAGLVLRPYRGAIYSTTAGHRVGIAVATERKPNRWFLGLGEDDFDAAVLLCATASGRVIDVCLPDGFIAQHRDNFSRSGGQIKFNVARRDSRTILKIPSRQPEHVDRFIDAIVALDR